MLLYGLAEPQMPAPHLLGLGFADGDDCASNVGNVPVGSYCTLPDGSNIAVWNGAMLATPDGGKIDSANASSLVAAGWSAALVSGAGGGGGAASSSSGGGGDFTSFLKALAPAVVQQFGPKQASTMPVKPASSGPPWSMILLGGVIVIGLVALLRR